MDNKKLYAIDLFSGCGGLTLGLKQAGFTVLYGIDNDPIAVETYKLNHPDVAAVEKDIRKVKVRKVKELLNIKKGELDLLAGCPPCQGFSTHRTYQGKRQVNDPRNELLFEYLRFVKKLRPKAVMMENVPGLYGDHRLLKLKERLIELGYDIEIKILNAADYGVPQRRKRLIILGSLFGKIPFAERISEKRTVRETIENLPLPGSSGDPLHDIVEKRTPKVMDIIKSISKDGGSRSDLPSDLQLECHKNFGGFRDVYGRMAWDEVSPTITGGCINPSKGRFLHPDQDRAITLREAALLQSFPDDYKFFCGKGKYSVAQMIGNALPPLFIKYITNEIKTKLLNSNYE